MFKHVKEADKGLMDQIIVGLTAAVPVSFVIVCVIEVVALLGQEEAHVGGQLSVVLESPPDATSVRPVVLRRVSSGDAELVYPSDPADWPTLDQFPEHPDGRSLTLVAGSPAGEHRYDVALVSADATRAGTWEALAAAVRAGSLHGGSATVTVV